MKEVNKDLDVVLVGRVTIDINPVDFALSFVECPTFNKFMGGSPANTSIGLAKLGCRPGFIGRVSDDSLGDYVAGYLEKNGVDVSQVKRCTNNETLGLSFIETRKDGSSNLMMYRNGPVADLQLCTEDISEDYIARAKMLVVSGTSLAGSPSREAAMKCLFLAKKLGVKIVFDIDYRAQTWTSLDEVSVYYTLAGRFADIIIGSREEFDLMDRLVAGEETDEETAERWFKAGAELLIIKHGKEGSYAYEKNGAAYKILPFLVKSLKSTGGGDAYASAFLSGMIKGLSLEECLTRGTASASIAVAADNCSDALPYEEQLSAFIADRKAKGEQAVFPM